MIFTTEPRPALNLPKLYAKRRQQLLAQVWKLNSQAWNIFFWALQNYRQINNMFFLNLFEEKHLGGSVIDVWRGLFYAFLVCRSCSTYLHCTAVCRSCYTYLHRTAVCGLYFKYLHCIAVQKNVFYVYTYKCIVNWVWKLNSQAWIIFLALQDYYGHINNMFF